MKNSIKLEKRGGGTCLKPNLGAFHLSPKKAFTLAEVLITLGIIGVVAAMTIPTLMQKCFEIQTVARFKEVNSILSQAIKLAVEENGEVSSWGNINQINEASALAIAKNLKPHLKLAHDCGTYDDKNMCIARVYTLMNGKVAGAGYATNKSYYKVVLMNGSSIFWRGRYGGDYPKNGEVPIMAFFFDINGSKGPNIVGHDLFSFVYYETYGFLPYGWFNPSGCIS